MNKNNIEKLLDEIESYHQTTFQENVEKRLDKTLKSYDYSLDIICDKVEKMDKKMVIKELSK